jgi:FKBP-type peptidyl-prolyl cis-trans isomerase FkpA
MIRVATAAVLLLLLPACRPDAPATGGGGFAAELGVDTTALTRTSSGLRYQEVVVGSGEEAKPGRTAVVHYTGWLPDGKKFDSSRDRGEPFSFPLGGGQVIAGWDEGVAGMKVGGRRKLVIPSELGYGAQGAPPDIPPNSTLVFDVELLGLQ